MTPTIATDGPFFRFPASHPGGLCVVRYGETSESGRRAMRPRMRTDGARDGRRDRREHRDPRISWPGLTGTPDAAMPAIPAPVARRGPDRARSGRGVRQQHHARGGPGAEPRRALRPGPHHRQRVTRSGHALGCRVYGASLVLLYAASTLYHGWRDDGMKRVLLLLDHIGIYVLIAGTYTPLAPDPPAGPAGLGAPGPGLGLRPGGEHRQDRPHPSPRRGFPHPLSRDGLDVARRRRSARRDGVPGRVPLAPGGGVAYAIGLFFFINDDRRFNHAIWHLFVLAGSFCHYRAVIGYVTADAGVRHGRTGGHPSGVIGHAVQDRLPHRHLREGEVLRRGRRGRPRHLPHDPPVRLLPRLPARHHGRHRLASRRTSGSSRRTSPCSTAGPRWTTSPTTG